MKKILAISMALLLLLGVTACGGSGGGSAGESEETYTFKFASSFGEGSDFNTMVEVPLKELLEEKSGGRMTLEIYPSGSLAAQGAALEAVQSGTADMGYDMPAIYAGTYQYKELFETPGFLLPGSKHASEVLQAYTAEYGADELEGLKPLAIYSTGNLAIVSSKPVRTAEDVKGMQIRASGPQIEWLANLGAVGTPMPVTDVYESVKLNIINGAILSPYAVTAFNLQEVSGYCTLLPMTTGINFIVMNEDLYNSMNDADKAIIDEVIAEFQPIAAAYGDDCSAKAMGELEGKMEFIELSEEEAQKFIDAGTPLQEKKAADMDSKGLDGTGAYEWLKNNVG